MYKRLYLVFFFFFLHNCNRRVFLNQVIHQDICKNHKVFGIRIHHHQFHRHYTSLRLQDKKSLKNMLKDGSIKETMGRLISKFFIYESVPPKKADSHHFKNMIISAQQASLSNCILCFNNDIIIFKLRLQICNHTN